MSLLHIVLQQGQDIVFFLWNHLLIHFKWKAWLHSASLVESLCVICSWQMTHTSFCSVSWVLLFVKVAFSSTNDNALDNSFRISLVVYISRCKFVIYLVNSSMDCLRSVNCLSCSLMSVCNTVFILWIESLFFIIGYS